jgi:hypothetical protein
MEFIDDIRLRIIDALASGILSIFIAAFASALIGFGVFSGSVFSGEAYMVLLTLAALPLVLTAVGLGLAVFRSGPFGFFGFLFELAGVNILFNEPEASAIGVVVLGAILVAGGAFVWSWTPVLEFFLESRNRRPPRRRGLR